MKRIKLIKLFLIFGLFFSTGMVQLQFTVVARRNFNLIRIGRFDDGGKVLGIHKSGDLVFLVDADQGLKIVNVTNKENSFLVGKFNPHAGSPQDVCVNGSYAFLANSFDGIWIINISTPTHPSNITHYLEKETIIYPWGSFESLTSASQDVFIDGSFGYIADGEFGVKVLNLTDLLNPTKIGEYCDEKGSTNNIIINDSYAYVADGVDGIEILDLSDLSNITRIGHYFDGGKARDLHLNDSYLYVADHENGLEILDVSDPSNIIEIGEFYDDGDLALGVFVDGDRAFVADNHDGLEVIDISDPTAPVEVGQYFATSGVVGLASDVAVDGDIIYVAFSTQGLEILTYGTPISPIPILPLTFIGVLVLGIGIWIIWGGKSQ